MAPVTVAKGSANVITSAANEVANMFSSKTALIIVSNAMSEQINPDDMRIGDLDKLAVKSKKGRTGAKIGLKITLYGANTHTY